MVVNHSVKIDERNPAEALQCGAKADGSGKKYKRCHGA